mgnify:CR=1 FL=1
MTEQIKQRQPLIELKDVTKTYHDGKRKDVFAVSNFNLTLYEGEYTWSCRGVWLRKINYWKYAGSSSYTR